MIGALPAVLYDPSIAMDRAINLILGKSKVTSVVLAQNGSGGCVNIFQNLTISDLTKRRSAMAIVRLNRLSKANSASSPSKAEAFLGFRAARRSPRDPISPAAFSRPSLIAWVDLRVFRINPIAMLLKERWRDRFSARDGRGAVDFSRPSAGFSPPPAAGNENFRKTGRLAGATALRLWQTMAPEEEMDYALACG